MRENELGVNIDKIKVDFSDFRTVWNKIVSEYEFVSKEEREKAKIPEDLFEWDEK